MEQSFFPFTVLPSNKTNQQLLCHSFAVGPLQCNCTIIADPVAQQAVVIDAGDEASVIQGFLKGYNWQVVSFLHTHAHYDHIGATAELACQHPKATAYLHERDRILYDMMPLQAQMIGLPPPTYGAIATSPLKHGQCLQCGDFDIEVIHTPGHSPGSVCFYLSAAALCFSGDTLFYRGIGRSDLWGSDPHALQHSIRHELYRLDKQTKIIPGHGPVTYLGDEMRLNPFVKALV